MLIFFERRALFTKYFLIFICTSSSLISATSYEITTSRTGIINQFQTTPLQIPPLDVTHAFGANIENLIYLAM